MRTKIRGSILGRRALAIASSAFLFSLVAALPARAQTTATTPATTTAEPDRWNVTGFIGPGFGGGLQGNALELGGAVGYNFTDRVAVEGEFGFARNSSNELINLSANTETFSANALYQVPYGSWLPYGTFGIGGFHGGASVAVVGVPGELSQSQTNFAFNLGGGVKRSLSTNVRFRGDLRFFDTGNGLPNFWRVYAGLTFLLGPR